MKMIIKNKTKLLPVDFFARINSVIERGKISKHNGTYSYCFVSAFEDCIVNYDLTRCGTSVFTINNL